jgi:putative cardiolipin synthase
MKTMNIFIFFFFISGIQQVEALPFFNIDIKLPSLKNPAESAYLLSTEKPQEITFINSGVASLKQRLDLIASAKQSIDLEFFIYNTDQAGRLITQALVRKAQKGIRVRLLIDYSLPVLQLDEYYTTELQKHGIEVRYYNKTLMLNLYGAQFRSHRKLILIDGAQPEDSVAITGGRNIADEYFDLGNKFNFRDSDVVIKGSLVQSIRQSFELFWNSDVVSDTPVIHPPRGVVDKVGYPERLRFLKTHLFEADEVTYERKSTLAKGYVTENNHDKIYRELIDKKGAKALAKEAKGVCHDTTFVADYPSSGPHQNLIFNQITKEFAKAHSAVQLESPYLVIKSDGSKLFQKLNRNGAVCRFSPIVCIQQTRPIRRPPFFHGSISS